MCTFDHLDIHCLDILRCSRAFPSSLRMAIALCYLIRPGLRLAPRGGEGRDWNPEPRVGGGGLDPEETKV